MLKIEPVHHVSLPASDLERSATSYEGVLGLEPMARPAFDFDGRWYKVGDRSLHPDRPDCKRHWDQRRQGRLRIQKDARGMK
jgi:catechol 2,3-dioxygenase-like lactoylglutathione lyase family enzyme